MENEIFNFTILSPVVVFDLKRLGEVCNELYNMEIYPIAIINNKENLAFKELNRPNSRPEGIAVECVILPFRYNKEFFA